MFEKELEKEKKEKKKNVEEQCNFFSMKVILDLV